MPHRPPTIRLRLLLKPPRQARPSASKRGYDRRWQRAAKAYLRAHPLCIMCKQRGSTRAATVVDHIRPHKGDAVLFWAEANWQPLCASHHSSKTAREDGGFGYRVRGANRDAA